MKAFTLYPKEERDLCKLLEKMKNYGKMNCDFAEFCQIYNEWHIKTFPGTKISTDSANWRDDWFIDFINYITNRDI
jgi:hypothetical protein